MQYLTNPLQHVLSMPSFPSSDAGLHHFTQVKWLFHLAQGLFLCSLPALYFFWKEVIRKGFGSLFQKVFIWAALVPVLVALIGLLVGFDQFFILFHKILFVGDQTWLFDPIQTRLFTSYLKNFSCIASYYFLFFTKLSVE